uniref:Small ribosomal subunit protein uS9c n=1 Tax=Tetrabaena socialis TaxID=47790 RepID=A0A1B1FKA6_9CHLO|nr:ribosomal protein S9 [Tetrabaena socialis]
MVILAKAVGRRKEAVAQVQIKQGTGQFIINNKPAQEYLQNDFYSLLSVKAPFDVLSTSESLLSSSFKNKNEGPKHEGNMQASKQPDSVSIDTVSTDDVSTDLLLTDQNKDTLKFDTIVKVKGGGLMGQAEAIRLGVSRAICLLSTPIAKPIHGSPGDEGRVKTIEAEKIASSNNTVEALPLSNSLDIRKQLKDKGYLTQDSRVKERRKYGLKKARKASQYHKR